MARLTGLTSGEGSLNVTTADASERSASPQGGEHDVLDKTNSRPIRAVGLLMLLQAIGLVGLSAYGLLQIDWQQVGFDWQQQEGLVLEIHPGSSQEEEESELEAARAVGAAILFLPS